MKAEHQITDSDRLEWLMRNISGAALRRIGVNYGCNCERSRIDAAMRGDSRAEEAEASLTDVLGRLANQFEWQPLSCSIYEMTAAGRAMRAAKAEIERLREAAGSVPNWRQYEELARKMMRDLW